LWIRRLGAGIAFSLLLIGLIHIRIRAKRLRRPMMADKAKGKMKEAAGAITGDEEKKAEGRAQQRKGAAGEEAAQKARTRQAEQEAKQAERERDRQSRKGKGPLGSLGDTLSGR
jgi:uncharacterized protein YjbJ (UPF0337 family)